MTVLWTKTRPWKLVNVHLWRSTYAWTYMLEGFLNLPRYGASLTHLRCSGAPLVIFWEAGKLMITENCKSYDHRTKKYQATAFENRIATWKACSKEQFLNAIDQNKIGKNKFWLKASGKYQTRTYSRWQLLQRKATHRLYDSRFPFKFSPLQV